MSTLSLSLTLLSARFGRFVDRPQLFVERDLLKTPASRERRLRRHLDHTIDRLRTLRRETGSAFNPYWGSVFSERDDTSLFGAQVENYACVYTSRVSNFGYVSPSRSFHAPHGSLPHW